MYMEDLQQRWNKWKFHHEPVMGMIYVKVFLEHVFRLAGNGNIERLENE